MIAVTLVVACGVASFLTTRSAYHSVLLSRDDYYGRYRFADVFAALKRAPNALLKRMAAIPGVALVDAVSSWTSRSTCRASRSRPRAANLDPGAPHPDAQRPVSARGRYIEPAGVTKCS